MATVELKWELVDQDWRGVFTTGKPKLNPVICRARVDGGWLYALATGPAPGEKWVSMNFVPDQK
jgi:hypothetical protein